MGSTYKSAWAAPAGASGKCTFGRAVITGLLLDRRIEGIEITVTYRFDYRASVERTVAFDEAQLEALAANGRLIALDVGLGGGVGRAVAFDITATNCRFLPVEARVEYHAGPGEGKTSTGVTR
jgi:hypothetical protein